MEHRNQFICLVRNNCRKYASAVRFLLSLAIANHNNCSYFVLSHCDVIILIISLNFVVQRLAFNAVSVLA